MESNGKDALDRWDRVRANTADDTNSRLDMETRERAEYYAMQQPAAIGERIETLEQEWDTGRWLEANVSVIALGGVALAALTSKRWLVLPAAALAFLLQHAVQGWCPPLKLFRRLGVRTRREIDAEKYALKALRGDFSSVDRVMPNDPIARAGAAVDAARR